MLHLRLVVPERHARAVTDLLCDDPTVANVAVIPRAARRPAGDLVLCDVAREGASDILTRLRDLGLDADGGITIQAIEAAPSAGASRAERAAPGSPDDGVVWDVVRERAADGTRGSWVFYVFLILATTIASVAIVLDSPILIVGAMVVGPEFAAVAAVATGLALRQWDIPLRALLLLAYGFLAAIAATTMLALLARAAGWIDATDVAGPRPLTGFVHAPDRWSFVVALLAGAAGVLSMTAGKTNALIGVFISVTTVPAAGNLALALALGVPDEMGGSALQLVVNVAGMVLAGFVVLLVQRRVWPETGQRFLLGPPRSG